MANESLDEISHAKLSFVLLDAFMHFKWQSFKNEIITSQCVIPINMWLSFAGNFSI